MPFPRRAATRPRPKRGRLGTRLLRAPAAVTTPTLVQDATGTIATAGTSGTVTLGAAPAAGNLLVFAMSGDKDTGALTLSGWTIERQLTTADVSLYLAWKVSAGTETTVTPTIGTATGAGNIMWVGEYAQTGTGTWTLFGTAAHTSDATTVTAWDTGTTSATTGDGVAVAVLTADSHLGAVTGVTWTNSYTTRYATTTADAGGQSGLWVGTKAELTGATTTTTGTLTGTPTADQMSGAVIVLGRTAPIITPPTFPASADLVEGTGTRSFAAVTTQAGDWVVVQAVVESGGLVTLTPSATGLTFTQQTNSDVGNTDVEIWQWTAPDAAGASRTVALTAVGSGNYRARLDTVRGSDGPGTGKGTSSTGQTVSVTRQGDHSAMFMVVGDWSAGAVGTPVWTPGGTTTASQAGTGATYLFGRWADSGTAGTAAHGISTPAFTTPSIAVLEMQGAASTGGPASGAATVAGAGAVTATAVQGAAAAVDGAGSVTATVVQGAGASVTGAGATAGTVRQQATASATGAGSVTAAGTVPAATPYADAVTTDSPAVWWRLAATGSPLPDTTATAAYNLAVTGTPTYNTTTLADTGDGSIRFANASLTYAEAPSNAAFSPSSLTVECLVQSDGVNGNNRIVQYGNDNSWRLTFESGQLKFDVAGRASANYTWPGDTARHHVAGTYSSATGTAILYLDGVEVARQVGTTGAVQTTADALRLGHKPTSTAAGDGWNGYIDELAIYSSALTPTRITAHAAAARLAGGFAAVTGAGTVAAAGAITGTATVTGAGSVTATGTATGGGAVTVTGTGSVTATVVQGATATVAGASTVAGTVTVRAGASVTGTGSTSATVVQRGTGTVTGTGSATADAQGTTSGTATITGAGTVTGAVTQAVQAAVTGVGSVTAAATVGSTAGASGAGATAATVVQRGASTVAGTGSVTAAAQGTANGTATVTGAGSVAAAATVTLRATATLTAAGAVTAAGAITGSAAISGIGSVTAASSVIVRATATVSGAGTISATVGQTVLGTATVFGAGAVNATGRAKWVFRPNTGTTTRPDDGRTSRPYAGLTSRP